MNIETNRIFQLQHKIVTLIKNKLHGSEIERQKNYHHIITHYFGGNKSYLFNF
jgi:hypothetical protein